MFFACCILHNMLLSNNEFDKRWEDDSNWEGQYGHHSNCSLTRRTVRSRTVRSRTVLRVILLTIRFIAYVCVHGSHHSMLSHLISVEV